MSRGGWSVLLGVILVALVAVFFWQLYDVNQERFKSPVYVELPLIGMGPQTDLFNVILFSCVYGFVVGVLLMLLFSSAMLASQDWKYRMHVRSLKEQLLETRDQLAHSRGKAPMTGDERREEEAAPAALETESQEEQAAVDE